MFWNWTATRRDTGKPVTFCTRGPYETEVELRDHVEAHYQQLSFVSGEPADGPPAFQVPVDPRFFQGGGLAAARRELGIRGPATGVGKLNRASKGWVDRRTSLDSLDRRSLLDQYKSLVAPRRR